MRFSEKLAVPPGAKVKLSDRDPGESFGFEKGAKVEKLIAKTLARLDELQNLLWADKRHALLVVLQSPDAGGKDGTIRHVMSGMSPQGCRVTAFKEPTPEELAHDFLWRVHAVVPAKGEVGIFNRSHYEDVLVVRVHGLVPRSVWSRRYDEINGFERLLAENQVTILKFFLHISKDEQKKRLEERLKDPAKQWKLSESDLEDRKLWTEYVAAYEEAISRCNQAAAPWFIIPANKKWFRNLAVSSILVETLEGIKLKFPKPSFDLSRVRLK
ncbi:MAG TPA: polyphosphate kinase 2 family protein [Terriglobia bacterium]|jgi:PPK2 family polyphosphate:nucleotide phosphotransferase|nr:polyphosphate kinase 2 family protein [Terriglobia bacterium]